MKALILCITLAYSFLYAKEHKVSLEGMKFVPASITVSVGDTVKFTNNSKILHNVVSPKSKVRSKMLRTGEIFILKITKKEDIIYYCEPHKAMGMKGTIKVE